ncbi:MAG: hypothetical protein HY518_02410, partial [Candidatus Aenigmarchaeota archaeon]|nr:hypothetical protein [Candidatus Aenigmarchaeota archaeon]
MKSLGLFFLLTVSGMIILLFSLGSAQPSSVDFDRLLDCHKCGQHKAPPLTDVTMTVTVTSDVLGQNVLEDYFPAEWILVEANGGTVTNVNATVKKIGWNVNNINGEVAMWYVVKSPDRVIPARKYVFWTVFAGQASQPWQVIVADPDATYNGSIAGFVINGTEQAPVGTRLDADDNTYWEVAAMAATAETNTTVFYDNFEGWSTATDCGISSVPIGGNWTTCSRGGATDVFIRGNNTDANNGTIHLDLRDWDSDGFPTENLIACADISGYDRAFLNFSWRKAGLDAGEYGRIDVNMTSTQAFRNIFDTGTGTSSYADATINITNDISVRTCVGLHSHENAVTEHFNVDDFRIIGTDDPNYTAAVNITSRQITQPISAITLLNVSLAFLFNDTLSATWYYGIFNVTADSWTAGVNGSISQTEGRAIILYTTGITDFVNASGYVKVRLRTSNNATMAFRMQMDHLNVTISFTDNPPIGSGAAINVTSPVHPQSSINHTAAWTEDIGLSWYRFEWNATGASCTGGFQNASEGPLTGLANQTDTIITLPAACNGTTIGWRYFVNDSFNQTTALALQTYDVRAYGYLNVSLTNPFPGPTNTGFNSTFLLNSSAVCSGQADASCGNVTASARYNFTGAEPAAVLNTSAAARPFYITSPSA